MLAPPTPLLTDVALAPKRLLFTPGPTPSPASAAVFHATPLHISPPAPSVQSALPLTPLPTSGGQAQQLRPASRSTSAQPKSQPVRYGAPPDPDADYFERFAHGAQRRFGLLDGFSSSDEEEDDFGVQQQQQPVQQQRSVSLSPAAAMAAAVRSTPPIAEVSPVESMLHRLTLEWQGVAEQRSVDRAARLQEAIQAADQNLASELQQISEHVQRKQMELVMADVRHAEQQQQVRSEKLRELQRLHDKSAAKQQEQLDKLAAEEAALRRKREEEEARRRKAEAEAAAARAAAEAEARAEADRKRREEEAAAAARRQQEAQQVAAAASKPQGEAGKAKEGQAAPGAAASSKASAAAKCMRCAPQAQAFESEVAARVDAMHAAGIKQLVEDESLKKQRRDIEKKMTVHVQQISATLDQVSRKCMDVHGLISAQTTQPWRHFAMLMFATKFVKQWELVMLNNKAAFPLATVLVKVSTVFPELMEFTLSLLHRECCFSVPCCFVGKDAESGLELTPTQLRRLLGYKEREDDTKPGVKVYESDDDFIRRVEGVMFLYGAIVQVEEARNPHGLEWGWRWLARFLNALPATRASSKALIFFLRAAGYGLYGRFKGQFVKLLKCMHDEFLPELAKSTEQDVQSVRTMLEHYLHSAEFRTEPEGRNMPKIDMSSFERA